MVDNIFGARVKKMREDNNMTQHQLTIALGSSNSTVDNWESYGRMAGGHTIVKLCKLFNCSADYLLGLSDVPNP